MSLPELLILSLILAIHGAAVVLVYRDATRLGREAVAWGALVLFAPLAGLVLYLVLVNRPRFTSVSPGAIRDRAASTLARIRNAGAR